MRVLPVVLTVVSLALGLFAMREEAYDAGLYTPAETRKNEIWKRLGVPPDPPKAIRPLGDEPQEILTPFPLGDSERYASKGYIGLHKGTTAGPLVGFLDCHKAVSTKENATMYAFRHTLPVMEVRVVGTHYRLAVATGSSGIDLASYSKNFHVPRHTLFSSAPGSGPSHDKVQAYLYETNVFTYSPDEGEIEVQWVNRNEEFLTTEIALLDDRVYLAGDVRLFSVYANRKVDHVVFKWYPAN
ncbi:hypothetical protein DFP72DRAFT_1058655 [Ephemerocybe angulata]|uniref:Uncharacterized protein n=1 Tax=Ephemerocybe angulata TaxID=980116 RepID=A0A8H6MDS6_9AGAR|nr:hypothetical protein DFP72DRAFT_1058655 [Tulosesus angulatus]